MKNIKCDIKKSLPIFLVGIGIVAVCFFLGFFDFRRYVDEALFNNDVIYYILKAFMIFSFIFLSFGIFMIGRSMLSFKTPMIQFGDDYMIDRSSYISGGKIQYTDISAVYIKGMFLCIRLNNEKQFLEKQNWIKRLFIKGNKRMGYEYITISDSFLDTNLFEIKKIIDKKRAE